MQNEWDPFGPGYDFTGPEVAAALASALYGMDDGEPPANLLALVDGRPRGELLGVTFDVRSRSLYLHVVSATGRVPRSPYLDRYVNREDVLRYLRFGDDDASSVRPRPRNLPPY